MQVEGAQSTFKYCISYTNMSSLHLLLGIDESRNSNKRGQLELASIILHLRPKSNGSISWK